MVQIHKGRFTADTDDSFVVFIIGMRINNLWQVWKWFPITLAMPRMLRVLEQQRDKGLLHNQLFFAGRTLLSLQYWQSFDHLERFARDPDDPHLEAWRQFNRRVGADGSVGIFHETYRVARGQWETVYGNMPTFGLAAATRRAPAKGRKETARRRLGGDSEPAVPSPQE